MFGITAPTKQQVFWTLLLALVAIALVYRVPMVRRVVAGGPAATT